jgi:hypothetical protein
VACLLLIICDVAILNPKAHSQCGQCALTEMGVLLDDIHNFAQFVPFLGANPSFVDGAWTALWEHIGAADLS